MLPIPKPPRADFFRVLDERRSRRPTRPLSQIQLATVLWYSAKEFAHRGIPGAADYWEHRAVPSAGGCHPIDLLVRDGDTRSLKWLRYEPRSHSLAPVTIRDRVALKSLQHNIEPVVGPPNAGSLIWLLAQPARTARRYVHPESLIWRDSGILIGTIAFIAEALGLASTPLGPTGEPSLSVALGAGRNLEGMGGILIGQR
jgi:hypothetical protein